MTTPRTFRSRDQWQSILDAFLLQGLSAPQFCKAQEIPYASFVKWRQKLSPPPNREKAKPSSFIDLSSMPHSSANWQITLKLGNGVELVLAQS